MPRINKLLPGVTLDPESFERIARLKYQVPGCNGNVSKLIRESLKAMEREMGVTASIDYERFPEQGSYLQKRTKVCFNYDTRRILMGTIVRDDHDAPGVGIIRLDDGRHILTTECQHSPE